MVWFFYNLTILIKYTKSHKNTQKALFCPRNQVFCLTNWKLSWASTQSEFIFFCSNLAHVFHLTISTKGCAEFFFSFKSSVIKNTTRNFADIIKLKTSIKLYIYSNLTELEALEVFSCLDKWPGFLKTSNPLFYKHKGKFDRGSICLKSLEYQLQNKLKVCLCHYHIFLYIFVYSYNLKDYILVHVN